MQHVATAEAEAKELKNAQLRLRDEFKTASEFATEGASGGSKAEFVFV